MIEHKLIITDTDADNSIKLLDAIPVIPATVEPFKSREVGKINNNTVPQKSTSKPVEDAEIKLLRAIVENPMRASSDYSNLARVSPNTFRKVRPILKDKGLISEHKLQANARGRSTILLGPTEQGKKYLSDYDSNKRNS